MKRRPPIVRILLLLVAGAFVNVAVAWMPLPSRMAISSGSVMAVTNSCIIQRSTYPTRAQWSFRFVPASATFPYEFRPVDEVLAPFGFDCLRHIERLHDEESILIFGWATAQGFPMLALRGFSTETMNVSVQGSPRELELFGLLVSDRGTSASPNAPQLVNLRPYPYIPIWPGFAINTVFYAFIVWLLFAAPFALRRRRRIKRGLCPKCAYPVGTNSVCTECGAAVSLSLGRKRAGVREPKP